MGLIVTAPEKVVDTDFWRGHGYLATDPVTGAGAYILNDANGGEFEDCVESSQPITKSISEQITTYLAIGVAALLLASATIGTGGTAAPALITAMRIIGVTALSWSSTSYAAGKCKNENCHRGSIQAQGSDITGPGVRGEGKGKTKSEAWAQPKPLTLSEGLTLLNALRMKLYPAELSARVDYFAQAETWIRTAAANGGVCASDVKPPPFGPNPAIADHASKGIRVDVVINAGEAFVP